MLSDALADNSSFLRFRSWKKSVQLYFNSFYRIYLRFVWFEEKFAKLLINDCVFSRRSINDKAILV